MRRRQIVAARTLAELPALLKAKPEQPAPVSLVGVYDCPKCGKHMKRGMAMHYKACLRK